MVCNYYLFLFNTFETDRQNLKVTFETSHASGALQYFTHERRITRLARYVYY